MSMRFPALLLLTLATAHPAHAFNAVSASVGTGAFSTPVDQSYRLGLRWDWWDGGRPLPVTDWVYDAHWELGVGRLEGEETVDDEDDLTEVGLSAVLRLRPQPRTTGFLEAGLGGHLLSDTQIADRDLATGFQFSPIMGTGLRFGGQRQYELGLRYRRISNAIIKESDDGLDITLLRFVYHYR